MISLLVFFSGFCSLLYQVIWDRSLRSNFGGDNVSSAVIVGTFLFGLGIGALVFGRRWKNPFRVYAISELVIGLYGLVSHTVLSSLASYVTGQFAVTIENVAGLRPAVVIGSILFLVPPCLFMGGTLPLIFQCFVKSRNGEKRDVAFLYSVNTFGAAMGILAGVYLFLNHFSVHTTLSIVATGNLLLALAAFALSFRAGNSEVPMTANVRPSFSGAGVWVGIVALSGFLSVAYEVVLFRFAFSINASSPYNSPWVVFFVLLGIAAGSRFLVPKRALSGTELRNLAGKYFLSSVAAIAFGIATCWLWGRTGIKVPLRGISVLPLVFIFPPLLIAPFAFWGALFPLAIRALSDGKNDVGRATGVLYLVNSVGSFAGAIGIQFFGFEYFSLAVVGTALLTLSFTVGISLKPSARPRWSTGLTVGLFLVATPWIAQLPCWRIYSLGLQAFDENIEYVEGKTGVAWIKWDDARQKHGTIFVHGRLMGWIPYTERHLKQILVPLMLPYKKNALVLGMGQGGVLRELVEDPAVEKVVVVDWSYELPELLSNGTANEMLRHAARSPKVKVIRADARIAIDLLPEKEFDIIFDNLVYPGWVGSTNVRSEHFFTKIRRVLNDRGAYFMTTNYGGESRLAYLASLRANFPYVNENRKLEVVAASAQPLNYEVERGKNYVADVSQILNIPEKDLIGEAKQFTFIGDTGHVPPLKDDLYIYEFTDFQSKPMISKMYYRTN